MTRAFWSGVYPALVCPMAPDQSIDEQALAAYATRVAAVPGVRGLVCNGNAGEVTLLSRHERRRVIEIVRAAVPRETLVVTGVVADSTAEAIADLAAARAAGADAALVFPIRDWLTSREPGSAEAFFNRIARAVDLPLFVFQYPHTRGNAAYPVETLVKLVQIPTVVAVKDAIWEVARYQEEFFRLREARPDLTILSANDEHVFATLCIGADGVLLGYAGLIPDHIARLVAAVARGDLLAARAIDAEIWPLTQFIYRTPPFARRHTRIKAALQLMGVIPSAMVREPLLPLDDDETRQLQAVLAAVGLLAHAPAAEARAS